MSVPLLFLKNIMLTFGGEPVFSDLSLQVFPRDKICLVGRNGCGKSTLLKVLAGIIDYDKGEFYKQPGLKIGYLPQSEANIPDISIYDYVTEILIKEEGKHKEEVKYLADQILQPLKLNGTDSMIRLSGGKLRRAALARALIEKPGLLLLDEPTNHLDIASILWLEEFMNGYNGSVLCISHDREFLRNTTNRTFWLDRGNFRVNNKGFAGFEEWSNNIYQQEEVELSKLGKKLDEENVWLQQGVTARRKRNQGRLRRLYELRSKMQNDYAKYQKANSKLVLPDLPENVMGKMVVEMINVSHQFDDVIPPKQTISNFSMRILKGEKIAIIGKNGTGKTTFLKLITDQLEPTGGKIKIGPKAVISYFDQKRESLNPENTLWETLCPDGGDMVKIGDKFRHVVSYLKDFMFTSAQAKSKVANLSGGEANRLLLGKILANPGNVLILDEPTNDLDTDTLDMLQDLLENYEGTLIIVSHDRDFIDKIATRTLIFEDDFKIVDYQGGYTDYTKLVAGKEVAANKPKEVKKQQVPTESLASKKKLTYKDQRDYDMLPGKIDELTTQIAEIEAKLAGSDIYSSNPEEFNRLVKLLDEYKNEVEMAEIRWIELDEMVKKL